MSLVGLMPPATAAAAPVPEERGGRLECPKVFALAFQNRSPPSVLRRNNRSDSSFEGGRKNTIEAVFDWIKTLSFIAFAIASAVWINCRASFISREKSPGEEAEKHISGDFHTVFFIIGQMLVFTVSDKIGVCFRNDLISNFTRAGNPTFGKFVIFVSCRVIYVCYVSVFLRIASVRRWLRPEAVLSPSSNSPPPPRG